MRIIYKLVGNPMRIQGVKDSGGQVTRSEASALNTQDIQISKALKIYTLNKRITDVSSKIFFVRHNIHKELLYIFI